MGTPTTLLTFEEFEQMPDQPGKQELLRGELIELPPADLKHNRLAERIRDCLRAALAEAHKRGHALDLGEACHEMGYKLSDGSWVQPDVSITHAGQPEGKYFGDSPAIAIEIVSPSNTAESMALKTALYFQFGAREVWRVYQKTRHVDVHVPGSSRMVTADQTVTTPLLPGFAHPVAEMLGE